MNIDTATRMTNSSSTLIDYIITEGYGTCIVADKILKTDHFAQITVLKSVMLKSKTTKKKFFDEKNYSAIAFQNFIENSDWRHFYGEITGVMMLIVFQRIIEKSLALFAPIKACFIRKDKPKFLLREKWLCEKTKKQFSRISDDKTKNDLTCQKKQLLSSLMELNSEKARWNFIQDLRNKEKTQTRIHSFLNSFGNKITKPMEIANLLNYRFSTLGEFNGLQQTINNPPKIPIYNSQGNKCAHRFIEYK